MGSVPIRTCPCAARVRGAVHPKEGKAGRSEAARKRMDARGMFWADVEAVLDNPQEVRDDGLDRWDRPKWI